MKIENEGNINALDAITRAVLRSWPEHSVALDHLREVTSHERQTQNRISHLILKLVGDELDKYVFGYKWICQMILEEELEFRRSGKYKCSSFVEAERTVYSNNSLMASYMDGLLLSQVLWTNHVATINFYTREFLGNGPRVASHLEIGPGHGLLLFLASSSAAQSTGWDVSATSVERTRSMLAKLGAESAVSLEVRDLFGASSDAERFDRVVISEVIEHLERPVKALVALRSLMTPGARIYINAPVNSPTIDHIFLFRTPEEVVELVCQAGFDIESVCVAPATGFTETTARKFGVSISCAVIAKRPN
jgi:2-polyprenyl-3-methyl-5-hydroxy-6-metoxy-1,4-benzoquinol methylase